MGASYSGQCFLTAESARDFQFSHVPPVIDGGFFRVLENTAGGWKMNTYQNGVLRNSHSLPVPSYSFCDAVDNFQHGAEIGFSIGLCFLIAFGFLLMRRMSR